MRKSGCHDRSEMHLRKNLYDRSRKRADQHRALADLPGMSREDPARGTITKRAETGRERTGRSEMVLR
jgi:hypothetical protein